MFVRWKRRESTYARERSRTRADERGATLYAVLVESVRVDGKPRQKFICQLAKVREKKLDYESMPFQFWKEAIEKLNTLALDESERKKIELQLAAKIRRPSDAEAAEFWQKSEKFWQGLVGAFKAFGPCRRAGA